MRWLTVATVFASALLLFLVQPLAAKVILPVLGGTPAVWNTAMVFFQATLLAGYAYAHGVVTVLGARRAALAHVVVVVLGLLALPIGLAETVRPPEDMPPALWLLGALGVMVGVPFFVLSSTSSLLQRWLVASGEPGSDDPYWLYAASNVGSLIALLGYPVAMEPTLTLDQQQAWWSWGYGVFAVFMVSTALRVWFAGKRGAARAVEAKQEDREAARITWGRRGRWIVLAAIPSALMLGVTQHITTDIAAVPLLWVLPLALYLLTFVIAFGGGVPIRDRYFDLMVVVVTLALVAEFLTGAVAFSRLAAVLHLVAFFVLALHTHTRLAADRPDGTRVTEFFLFVSIGGVVGGILTALVAPAIFDEVLEYPIAIALALLFRKGLTKKEGAADRKPVLPAWGWAIVAGGLCAMIAFGVPMAVSAWAAESESLDTIHRMRALFQTALSFVVVFAFLGHRAAFAAAVGVALISARLTFGEQLGPRVWQERTFFGIHKVIETRILPTRAFLHGLTLHGRQFTDQRRSDPTLYFHRDGPLGSVFLALEDTPLRESVAITGLGVGTIAAYMNAGETITFYEIDPVVVEVAEDERFFTYLSDARGRGVTVEHVVGDARLRVEEAPDGSYGIMVIDAFTSDAIPVHLLTVEAIELYFTKLVPGGVVLCNISNRHVDMAPIFAANARELGIEMRYAFDPIDEEQAAGTPGNPLPASSAWVLLARTEADLEPAMARFDWRDPGSEEGALPRVRPWTDGYSNLLSAIRWGGARLFFQQ